MLKLSVGLLYKELLAVDEDGTLRRVGEAATTENIIISFLVRTVKEKEFHRLLVGQFAHRILEVERVGETEQRLLGRDIFADRCRFLEVEEEGGEIIADDGVV